MEIIELILDELRARLSDLYGNRLIHIVLYGSRAREDAEPGSDIDVLVVLKGPVHAGREIARTGKIVAELSLNHDEVISCVFIDEQRYLTRNGPFLRNVRREGVLL